MRIGFVGAGKVATAFGRYLHGHDVNISGFYDHHPEKTTYAAQATDSRKFTGAAEVADRSDILLITTQDDKIGDACKDLCRQGAIASRHLVGHMSGVHASGILEPAADVGAATFSLHPLQAFADEQKALGDLPHTYFSLESDDRRADALEAVLTSTGNPFFRLNARHKILYHLSAVVLSNYLVTLMDGGLAALKQSGIDPDQGFAAMQPLIMGTLANIAKTGTARALTGPIARGDTGTIDQHMAALDAHGLEAIKSFYTFMGLRTLELAEKEILKAPEKAQAVRKSLEKA